MPAAIRPRPRWPRSTFLPRCQLPHRPCNYNAAWASLQREDNRQIAVNHVVDKADWSITQRTAHFTTAFLTRTRTGPRHSRFNILASSCLLRRWPKPSPLDTSVKSSAFGKTLCLRPRQPKTSPFQLLSLPQKITRPRWPKNLSLHPKRTPFVSMAKKNTSRLELTKKRLLPHLFRIFGQPRSLTLASSAQNFAQNLQPKSKRISLDGKKLCIGYRQPKTLPPAPFPAL